MNNNAVTESNVDALTQNTPKFEKSLSDNSLSDFMLSENSFETDKYSSYLSGSPLNLNGKSLRDRCFIYTESRKLNNPGLLERNIIPFLNISRNILFHSLQIHF